MAPRKKKLPPLANPMTLDVERRQETHSRLRDLMSEETKLGGMMLFSNDPDLHRRFQDIRNQIHAERLRFSL